jgi:hypothetical protein
MCPVTARQAPSGTCKEGETSHRSDLAVLRSGRAPPLFHCGFVASDDKPLPGPRLRGGRDLPARGCAGANLQWPRRIVRASLAGPRWGKGRKSTWRAARSLRARRSSRFPFEQTSLRRANGIHPLRSPCPVQHLTSGPIPSPRGGYSGSRSGGHAGLTDTAGYCWNGCYRPWRRTLSVV